MPNDPHPLALTPDQLSRRCLVTHFDFETTADLPSLREIIGQPRGVRAIEFGIDIQSRGYNIYVMGTSGTGRLTAIERFIRSRAADDPVPMDWMYIHNFDAPHKPLALGLPAGMGQTFCQDMRALLHRLRAEIPRAFETPAFTEIVQSVEEKFHKERNALLERVQALAAEKSFIIRSTPQGLMMAPTQDGEMITQEVFDALSEETLKVIETNRRELETQVEETMNTTAELEAQAQETLDRLQTETTAIVLDAQIGSLVETYVDYLNVVTYLQCVREDVLANIGDFSQSDAESSPPEAKDDPPPGSEESGPKAGPSGSGRVDGLRRYEVNLIVDHGESEGAPVVVVSLPTYQNLIGRIEHRVQYGALSTDFTMIKPGALHQANGGFLAIKALDILRQPFAWEALKRALNSGQVCIEEPESRGVGVMTTQVLEPAPIPVQVKVVMLGNPMLYYMLFEQEEEFPELFKVKADFADTMDRDHETEGQYASFVAARCHEEELPHFDAAAVGRIVDYSSWLAGDQEKLSTRFGEVTDLIHEAVYCARRNEREIVMAEDVVQASEERRYRNNLYEELSHQRILDEQVIIATEGSKVGQINGLTVIQLGDHTFGQPSRITARAYLGEQGVVQIEREVRLTGPIHDKGLLILRGYLGSTYAQDFPLTLSASLTFEQNYGGVEGDSASSTELYALLSAIAELPIRQDLAVTGSVDQHGVIQPIGGGTAKIEGFFHICQERGLTGRQGVLIPRANVRNLMLNEEVVAAVEAGRFHIYAIETIDQGIELLTGIPAGKRSPAGERQPENGPYPPESAHYIVQNRLRALAEGMRAFTTPTVNIHQGE